jgi:hypothetical protein
MRRARSLVIESFGIVLAGCPFAMENDYVIQTMVVQPPDANVDAGAPPTDAPPCVPATCEKLEARCGTVSDGCGAMLDCGTCKDGEVCGLKTPNHCDRDRPEPL